MKKLLIIACIFNSTLALGQVSLGIKTGTGITSMNLSEFYQEDFNTKESSVQLSGQTDQSSGFVFTERNSFTGGVYAHFQLSKLFSIQSELIFSGKGFVIDYEIEREVGNSLNILDVTDVYRFNYMDVPLLLRLNGRMGHLRPYVLAGGAPSFLVASRVLHKQRNYFTPTAEFESDLQAAGFETDGNDIDLISNAKGFDFSILGGVGFDYEVSEMVSFKVEGRYSYGINDIYNPGTTSEYNSNVTGWALFIGVGFNLNAGPQVCVAPDADPVETTPVE